MGTLIANLRKWFPSPQRDGADAMAALLMAARDDAAFKARLLAVLRLPPAQREPLVRTAVDEMRLRGEPADAQLAFATLATDEGARTALRFLEGA